MTLGAQYPALVATAEQSRTTNIRPVGWGDKHWAAPTSPLRCSHVTQRWHRAGLLFLHLWGLFGGGLPRERCWGCFVSGACFGGGILGFDIWAGIQIGYGAVFGNIQAKPLPIFSRGSGPSHCWVAGSLHLSRGSWVGPAKCLQWHTAGNSPEGEICNK